MRKKILAALLFMVSISTLSAVPKVKESPKEAPHAGRFYVTGGFEIYAIPNRFNSIVDDEIGFGGWVSHIPLKGKYVEAAHRGTDHNLIYDYDTHVPIVLWGSPYITKGQSEHQVSIVDIIPTLTHLMQINNLPNAVGHPLSEAIVKNNQKSPKAVVVFVIDQGGWVTLNNNKDHWPHLAKMMEEGFTFKQAYVDYGGAGTAASHAVIGTGTYPAQNGVFDNKPYLPSIGKRIDIYASVTGTGVDMLQLRQPTMIDIVSNIDKKAVTMSYGNASRAALGMGGHGSSYRNNGKNIVFWFNDKEGKFGSDEKFFVLPESVKTMQFNYDSFLASRKDSWQNQTCFYKDNKPFNKCWMGSPGFAAFEGEMLKNVILAQREAIADSKMGLFFINIKGTDYCGHYLGQESLECHETFQEVDSQISKIVETLQSIVKDELVAVVTADHGVSPLPDLSGGTQLRNEELMAVLNEKFGRADHISKPVQVILNSVIHLDKGELTASGHSIDEVVKFLKQYKVAGKPFFYHVEAMPSVM